MSDSDTMAGLSYYYEFRSIDGGEKIKDNEEFRFRAIGHNEKIENHDRPRYWDAFLESIPNKKLRLFIVSKDNVEKYGWKTIFKNRIYNKKIELSLEDLENQNWEIIYE